MKTLFFRTGAWCWVVTGVVHDAIDMASRVSPPETETQLNSLLRDLPFDLLGMGRSYYEVTMGISLGMGLAMIVVGALLLFLARTVTDVGYMRQASLIGLGASLSMLAIAVSLEPLPPIITFGVASLCFARALSARSRRGPTARSGTEDRPPAETSG